jgi:predicted site-specific integrase-resolvase
MELPQLLTLSQVADSLSLSPHTIRTFVRKGKLHPLRLCRRLLFDPDEVTQMIDKAKGNNLEID